MEKFLSKVLDEQFQVTLEAPEEPPRQHPPPTTQELDDRLQTVMDKLLPASGGDVYESPSEASSPAPPLSIGHASPDPSQKGIVGSEKAKAKVKDSGWRKAPKLTAAQNAELEQRLAQIERMAERLAEKEGQLEREKEAMARRRREVDQMELALKRQERELLEEQRDTAARIQEEQLQLLQERETLLAASRERKAELSQVVRYNDELIDLGALLRKEQEETNTLTALLQSREQQMEVVTHQNRQLTKIVQQREAEVAEVTLALEEAQARCARLEGDMRRREEELQRAAEEREEAQDCIARLQSEKADLQDAIDVRARELVDMRHKHDERCAQLRQAEERLKEAARVKAVAGEAGALLPTTRLERSVPVPPSHETPLARPLRWRDPKVGLVAAGVFCLVTLVSVGGSTGAEDRETLRKRNTELGRLTFQQRTELDRCHSSVNVLTERLATCIPTRPGVSGSTADSPRLPLSALGQR